MYRLGLILLMAMMVAGSAACTIRRAYISYDDLPGDIPLRATGWDGMRLGKVTAGEGGALWVPCTKVAEGSVHVLIQEARKLGANALGEVRWSPHSPRHVTTDPTCKQRWGWFLLWPMFATPAFQTASVEAYAYRIEGTAPDASGMFVIPEGETDREALAARIVAETLAPEAGPDPS